MTSNKLININKENKDYYTMISENCKYLPNKNHPFGFGLYEVAFDCVEGCDDEAEDVAFHLPYFPRRD